MQILNTYSGARLALIDNAEQSSWESSNPAVGEFLINTESRKIVYLDDNGDVQEIDLSGGAGGVQVYTIYVPNYSGSDYVNANLIDASPQMFFMDGYPRKLVTGSPNAGSEWAFDDTTGTITIGTNFDSNDLIIQYKSAVAPII